MKEIKFRAWNTQENRMLYREFFDMNWYTTEKNDETGSHCWGAISGGQRNFLRVMQYTGLKDKNGKEIYEGDILRSQDNQYGRPVIVDSVFWNDDYGCWSMLNTQNEVMGSKWGNEILEQFLRFGAEIIGNIYENSELLK